MKKKVFLGVGHGGRDPGAVDNGLQEKDVNLSIALACKTELERHGVIVGISRTVDEDDLVTEEVKECNAFAPDLAADIHTNAGGGDGFEAIYSVEAGLSKELAQNIEIEVKGIGQNSRGIYKKTNTSGTDYFAFVRDTNCPAVIVECAFIDSIDVQIIDTQAERERFAIAYAKGILKTLEIAYIEEEEEEVAEVRYNTMAEVPIWAKETIQKLIDKKILSGTGEGLDLSKDMARLLVINDRAGAYK